MMPRPTVLDHHPLRALALAGRLVGVLLFLALTLPTFAQDDGIWRIQVRYSVTRGEAERALSQLDDIPGIEMVQLPSGAYAVYVGRYASEEDAQRAVDRFLETGIRLGNVTYIPSATPTPALPSPTPAVAATPQQTPAVTPEPIDQAPESLMGTMTPPPAPSPASDERFPIGVILAIITGLAIVGTGVYLLILRKKRAVPPPPVNVRPTMPAVSPKPKPKPVSAISRPEPKSATAAKTNAHESTPATPVAKPAEAAPSEGIQFTKAPTGSDPEAPAARQPIAMSDTPQAEPTPAIILNDIFEDEPESPASANPAPDEGLRLDFLMDEDAKASSAGGNGGTSGTDDEGLGLSPAFGAAGSSAVATPFGDAGAVRAPMPASQGDGSVLYELDLSNARPGGSPPGWSGSYDYAKLTVEKDPDSAEQPYMRFEKESGIGSAYYSCQFPEAHGRLAVDFHVRCDDKNKYLLGFYIEKDQDFRQSVHALIHRTNAKASPVLRLQNESVPYDFGTWRNVRYEIDLVRHIIDGFVDGEPLIVGQRLSSCPDGLNTLSIRDNLATTGVLMLRGIRITAMD